MTLLRDVAFLFLGYLALRALLMIGQILYAKWLIYSLLRRRQPLTPDP